MPGIKQAARACLANPNKVARPQSWKGQRRAVDLGCNLDKHGATVICPMGRETFAIEAWEPQGLELIEDWEILDKESLFTEEEPAKKETPL